MNGTSTGAGSPINPGGPIRGLNPINPGGPINGGSTATSGGPIILVNDFAYTIVGGTGQYANDQGSGIVQITTTPGITSPTGPGIYSMAEAPVTGFGQTTVTFESGLVPLA